jgi:hypothetical protein
MQNASLLKFLGRSILTAKNFCIDETTSWSQTASFWTSSIEIDRRIPEEGRDKKWNKENWQTRNLQFYHVGRRTSQGECYERWFVT